MDKLQNNALIVKVECTKWSNTIEDRDISVEIVSDKNAEDQITQGHEATRQRASD